MSACRNTPRVRRMPPARNTFLREIVTSVKEATRLLPGSLYEFPKIEVMSVKHHLRFQSVERMV